MQSFQVRGAVRNYLNQNCEDRPLELCRNLALGDRPMNYDHATILDEVRKAWYCLQPAGDGPTRQNVYECMAIGTIPVLFDRYTKDIMPFADILDWDDMSVTLEFAGIAEHGENAIDALDAQFDLDRALRMSEQVHELRHLFLYSSDPDHSLVRFDEMDLVHPRDDAFTASMKSFMRHACRTGQLPAEKCMTGSTAVDR
jgi:hypothetical protein